MRMGVGSFILERTRMAMMELGIPLWVVAWDIWCAEGEGELRRAMKVTMCNKADDAFETRFESVQKINKIKELINSKRIDEEFFYLIQ